MMKFRAELNVNYLIQQIDKISLPVFADRDTFFVELDATTLEDAKKEMQDVIDNFQKGLIVDVS
jgi:hypothetical protein